MLQEITEPLVGSNVLPGENSLKNATGEVIQKSWFSDYLGMSGSMLCLIHCVAPQLIVLGSIGVGLGSFFASGVWHLIFWATCLLAAWQSARLSSFPSIKAGLWFSFALFSLGIGYEWFAQTEHWISYVGSVCLIAAHISNLVAQQKLKKIARTPSC